MVTVEAESLDRSSSSSSSVGSVPEFLRHLEIPELGPKDVHPYHAPSKPTHEEIKASPHYPVVVTPNPMVERQVRRGGRKPVEAREA